jgi:hypothetical protein
LPGFAIKAVDAKYDNHPAKGTDGSVLSDLSKTLLDK